MKKFLYKFTLFLVLLILVVLSIHLLAKRNHVFISNELYYKDAFNKAYKYGDFDVLVLGNSKVLSAIDKKTLTENKQNNVGMLGYSSSNVSVTKLILESYLNKNIVKPKLVLFEVSWFTFNNERTGFHDIIGDLFIEDPSLWNNYNDYDKEMLLFKIKKAYKKSLTNLFKLNNNSNKNSYEDTFKASSPFTKNYSFDQNKFEELFPEHVANIDALLLRDFNVIVEMCKANNIKLILFSAPEDEVYSKNQSDA